MQDFKFSLKYKTEIAALVTRNVLFPLVILSLVFLLPMPNGMGWIKEILVVQAAMPAGIFAVVIVGNYAEDKDTAMRSIIVTMFASLVTLPLWIILGLSIVR
jgi:predicted permease